MVLVLKETCGYMNQLLGLERTTFEKMTSKVLVEHYRDRNNRPLGNQFAQPADKFSLVFLQLYWEGNA